MCCTSVEQGALSKQRILLICSITLVTMVLTGQRNDLSRAVHQSVTIVNKLMFCVARRVIQPLAAPSLGSASRSLRSHKLVRQPGNRDHQIKKHTSRKNGTDTPRCKAPHPMPHPHSSNVSSPSGLSPFLRCFLHRRSTSQQHSNLYWLSLKCG